MAEITKIPDKQEYELNDFGEQKVKLRMGGKSTAEFAQNLNMSFECHSEGEQFYINVNRIVGVKGDEDFTPNTKVKIAKDKIDDEFEPVGNDKLRWLIKYKEDPRPTQGGNYVEEFELKFSSKLKFYKQPSTYQGFLDVEPGTIEPADPSIYGSYAVYQTGLWGKCIDNVIDRNVIHDAGCGKLCHIYARRAYDSNGKEQWLEPTIDNIQDNSARMTVTIPADFWDSAVFPVFMNDTFGYGVGASSIDGPSVISIAASGIDPAAPSQPSSNGTIDSIDLYSRNVTTTTDVKVGLYDDSGGAPNSKQGTEEQHDNVGAWNEGWKEFAMTTDPPSVTTSTTYYPSISGNAAIAEFWYDVLGAGTGRFWDTHTWANAWPATFTVNASSAAIYSIRATYTPSAGGLSIPVAQYHYRSQQ